MRITALGPALSLRIRPMVAAGAACALSMTLAVRSAAADVAEWIPSDALVVFKINNLQRVNQEAAALLKEFGLAEQNPQAADPLAAFQEESGLRQGLNLDGNLGAYLANGDLEGDTPPVVILMPVTDYAAFLKNFTTVEDVGGGISRVRMDEQGDDADDEAEEGNDDGDAEEMDGEEEAELEDGEGDDGDEPAYVMQMGEYAAISPMQELLKKPQQAIEFAGVTGERVNERDMVIYANFQQLGPMLMQKMQQEDVRGKGKQEMMQNLQENAQFAKFAPVAAAAFDQVFNAIDGFLRDTQAAALTMDLSEGGIAFGTVAQFKPDSYLAKTFAQLEATDDSLLGGLPEGNYIFFGGSADNQKLNQQTAQDFLGPIIAQLREVEGGEKLAEYADAISTQMTAAGETRFGMFAPSGPLGGSALVQQVIIQGGDVQKLLQSQRRVAELQPEIMGELMGEQMDEMGMGMNMRMQYQEDAKEVAGIQFDKLSADMGEDEQQAAAMPMKMMFGPEGPTSYLGEVADKLVVVSGLTDQQITQVVEAVRGNSSPLSDDGGVQMITDQLMDERSAVFFFRPDELVKSGVGYARQMGMNLPIQLKDNLPPAGFAMGPAENAVQSEAFFPKDLISALIVAALQAQQQMGGMGDDGL